MVSSVDNYNVTANRYTAPCAWHTISQGQDHHAPDDDLCSLHYLFLHKSHLLCKSLICSTIQSHSVVWWAQSANLACWLFFSYKLPHFSWVTQDRTKFSGLSFFSTKCKSWKTSLNLVYKHGFWLVKYRLLLSDNFKSNEEPL